MTTGRLRLIPVLAGLLAAGLGLAWGQTPAEFEARSVTLRTALHQDASLEAPFAQLLELYGKADRLPELRQIYEAHLAQYPADQGARAVHLRLLLAADDPRATEAARDGVRRHPGDSYLHALLHRATGELAPLSHAIELETRGDRRSQWLEELTALATGEAERALASARLREERDRRLAVEPGGLLELIQWMERAGFTDLAGETLAAAEQAQPSAELIVDLTLIGARLGTRPQAQVRLSALLDRLAADHPRRAELVLARREFSEDRAALLAQAREGVKADPNSAAHGTDLATLLEAEGKRREAGEVLADAALRLPHLPWIENRARDLLTEEPAVWRAYVERRLLLQPERPDLRPERIALAFRLDGPELGRKVLRELVGEVPAQDLDMGGLGTDLLDQGLAEAAEEVFRAAGTDYSMRAGLIRALMAQGDSEGVAAAVKDLPVDGVAPEEWVRLAENLEREGFEAEARDLLRLGMKRTTGSSGAMLALAKLSAPLERAELLEKARALAGEGDAYRDWLIAAAAFAAAQGDTGALWNREAARLSARSTPIDAALIRRVGTFAEVAAERAQEDVARGVVTQVVERAGPELLDSPEVRRLAVTAWEHDPSRAPDVERHLLALIAAAPESSSHDDRLRLALLYERVRRPDLASAQWQAVDWDRVETPSLLDAATGFGPALKIWNRLTALRPGDASAWERRLNALREADRELEFRSALKKVLAPGGPIELSEPVRADLRARWFASWGCELERERGIEAVMSKIRALTREDLTVAERNWARWFGASVLARAGRETEANAWRSEIQEGAAGDVNPAALRALLADSWEASASETSAGLVQIAALGAVRWKFAPPEQARIAGLAACGNSLVVLDDRGGLISMNPEDGRLRWRSGLGIATQAPPPGAMESPAPPVAMGEIFVAPDLVSDATMVFVGTEDRILAWDGSNGAPVWEAQSGRDRGVRRGSLAPASARIGLVSGDLLVALFPWDGILVGLERATGRLRWKQSVPTGGLQLPALAIGFAASGPAVAISGPEGVDLFRAATGERVWRHQIASDGPIRLVEGPKPAGTSEVVARHLAFGGSQLFAMENGSVHGLPVAFPGAGFTEAVAGVCLGGDERGLCFAEADRMVWLEVGTGRSLTLGGAGAGFWVGNGQVVRGGPDRLTSWRAPNGRKVGETAGPGEWPVPTGIATTWRGVITEERWQGCLIRRCRAPWAVAMSGGLAVAGEREIVGFGGKESR